MIRPLDEPARDIPYGQLGTLAESLYKSLL